MSRQSAIVAPDSLGKPAAPPRSYAWLQGLLCGVAATLVPGPALLVAFLLAPGLLSLLLDQKSGKPMARAVLLAGLAASVHPIGSIWAGGGGIGAALDMLGNPAVLGVAWLAGAGGWLVSELAPLFLRVGMDGAAAARATRLKAARTRLVEAWDLEPRAEADQAGEARPS